MSSNVRNTVPSTDKWGYIVGKTYFSFLERTV